MVQVVENITRVTFTNSNSIRTTIVMVSSSIIINSKIGIKMGEAVVVACDHKILEVLHTKILDRDEDDAETMMVKD